MANDVGQVYVDLNLDGYTQIEPQYVYLTIPKEFVGIYLKLLKLIADLGENIVKDCEVGCNDRTKHIINCWNLFQSALACHQLERYDEANFFLNYIKEQLHTTYNGTGVDEFNGIINVSLTKNGHIKAIVDGSENPKFYIDENTGRLFKEINDGKVYIIKDNNIIVGDDGNKI